MRWGRAALLCGALLLSGCQWSDATRTLSLGPQEKTVILVVEPGDPLQILSKNVIVAMRRLKDNEIGEQRIDGWIAMPPGHWRELEELLKLSFPPPPPASEMRVEPEASR